MKGDQMSGEMPPGETCNQCATGDGIKPSRRRSRRRSIGRTQVSHLPEENLDVVQSAASALPPVGHSQRRSSLAPALQTQVYRRSPRRGSLPNITNASGSKQVYYNSALQRDRCPQVGQRVVPPESDFTTAGKPYLQQDRCPTPRQPRGVPQEIDYVATGQPDLSRDMCRQLGQRGGPHESSSMTAAQQVPCSTRRRRIRQRRPSEEFDYNNSIQQEPFPQPDSSLTQRRRRGVPQEINYITTSRQEPCLQRDKCPRQRQRRPIEECGYMSAGQQEPFQQRDRRAAQRRRRSLSQELERLNASYAEPLQRDKCLRQRQRRPVDESGYSSANQQEPFQQGGRYSSQPIRRSLSQEQLTGGQPEPLQRDKCPGQRQSRAPEESAYGSASQQDPFQQRDRSSTQRRRRSLSQELDHPTACQPESYVHWDRYRTRRRRRTPQMPDDYITDVQQDSFNKPDRGTTTQRRRRYVPQESDNTSASQESCLLEDRYNAILKRLAASQESDYNNADPQILFRHPIVYHNRSRQRPPDGIDPQANSGLSRPQSRLSSSEQESRHRQKPMSECDGSSRPDDDQRQQNLYPRKQQSVCDKELPADEDEYDGNYLRQSVFYNSALLQSNDEDKLQETATSNMSPTKEQDNSIQQTDVCNDNNDNRDKRDSRISSQNIEAGISTNKIENMNVEDLSSYDTNYPGQLNIYNSNYPEAVNSLTSSSRQQVVCADNNSVCSQEFSRNSSSPQYPSSCSEALSIYSDSSSQKANDDQPVPVAQEKTDTGQPAVQRHTSYCSWTPQPYIHINIPLHPDQDTTAQVLGNDSCSTEQTDHCNSFQQITKSSDQNSPKQRKRGKDKAKRSRKQRQRELNQKGDKDGSDMDAFVDTAVESEPAAQTSSETPAANDVDNLAKVTPEPQATPEEPTVSQEEPEPPAPTKPEPSPPVETPKPPTAPTEIIVEELDPVAVENVKNEEKTREESKESKEENVLPNNIEDQAPVIKKDKTELKYTYREDQWSPLNIEGKKHYDRHFLLQLQNAPESMEKPIGLPKVDIILDMPMQKNEQRPFPMTSAKHMVDFTPGYVKSSPSGKDGRFMQGSLPKRRSQQKGEPRKVIDLSLSRQDVTLHHTDNAWKGGFTKTEEPTDADQSKTKVLLGKIKSILNKLTPQKFRVLVDQVSSMEIDTEERLRGAIDLIFEKAISEPNFSVAYASMCQHLIHIKVPQQDKPDLTLRQLLLSRCQKEFQKDKADKVDFERLQNEIDKAETEDQKKLLLAQKEAAEYKAKKRSLGNIRFIGELFKLKMLTENIMYTCIQTLLSSNDDEDNLECLCRLLTTIGKELDHTKAKPRIDQYFDRMRKTVTSKKTSARVRFMLRDVVDLRENNWVPRREDNNPKTIEQIHREAQQEERQKQMMIQNAVVDPPPKRNVGRGRGPGSGGPPPGFEEGWQSVGKASARNQIDPFRMKITKQNVDENIQLGPGGGPGGRGGFMTWARGSSGGTTGASRSQESDGRPPTPVNRFSALRNNESYEPAGRNMGRGREMKGRLSNQGNPRGKVIARTSAEQDREAAIAAARHLAVAPGSGRRTPSGSRNQSRESSRNRDVPREREAPAPKERSEKDVKQRTKGLMDEYLHVGDLKEAILCVRELESPNSMHIFVAEAINMVLERSSQARQKTGHLMHDVVKLGHVSVEQYCTGLREIMEFAEDMEIDIPKIWQYLAELISPMIQDSSVPLSFLRSVCEPLRECSKPNRPAILVSEILHDAAHRLGHIKVGELWKTSRLQWSNFLPPSENINEFLRKNKLEFTIGPEQPRSPEGLGLSITSIHRKLDELIMQKNLSNEDVFDWIEANVGESQTKEPRFIRALITAVCESAITGQGPSSQVENGILKERCILLKKYLDHQANLELQAVYAIQAMVHKLEHPSGVLMTFFESFYDEEVISEDAFNQWDQSNDPAEQAGKGVARTTVVRFFRWLREAEEESQEDS